MPSAFLRIRIPRFSITGIGDEKGAIMRKILVAPSILSANFGELQKETDRVSNADMLHIDVMDGRFVDNITMGPVVIEKLKTRLKRDVHLMIVEPEKFVAAFCKAGANSISFHVDATKKPAAVISMIKRQGCKVGLAINPDRPVIRIVPYLGQLDQVLIMSVYAGFGGQRFMPSVLKKVRQLREQYGFERDIEIDGGINDRNVGDAARAGCNIIVAGSFVFSSKSPGQAVALLRRKAMKAAEAGA